MKHLTVSAGVMVLSTFCALLKLPKRFADAGWTVIHCLMPMLAAAG